MKNEVKKLRIYPRTLDDKLIKDGLEAISLLNEKEPYFLVGGIAVQSYLPTRCRRPTSDIDFAILRPLNYESFRNMIKQVKEYLQDYGYNTNTEKRSRTFDLDMTDSEGDSLSIEFVRRNEKNFDKHKKRLERELENAKSKIVEERGSTYMVACPEDIGVPKLARLIASLDRNEKFSRYFPKGIEPLSYEKLARYLTRITSLREEAGFNPADSELAEKLRFISDLYDIRVLSELTGFNAKYWKEAEQEWDTITQSPKKRNLIVKATLPAFE